MRVALVFVLLFATVLCRPARKGSDSSESSEEVNRRTAVSASRQKTSPVQNVAAAAPSDESAETSEDDEGAVQAPEEVKFDTTDSFSSDTASVDSNASDDDDDDDDESDEDEDDDDSDEPSTPDPTTASPDVFTEEPVSESTLDPILPTIVTDNGRGDSIGGYPDDYKSIIYIEDKSYHKIPGPYKSYEYVDAGKKTGYDVNHGNDVEKSMQMYKMQSLQVRSDLLEEDTSTPEIGHQGVDASSSMSQDQGPLPEEGDNASTNESGSTSNPDEQEEQEEKEESTSSASDSEESAADSASDESDASQSDSDEGAAGLDNTSEAPAVIAAK